MKSLGQGLGLRSPQSIEVLITDPPVLARIDDSPPQEQWALRTVEADDHLISVALPKAERVSLEIFRWPFDLDTTC